MAQDFTSPFEQPDVFRAKFTEEKHIPGLAKPLQSKGDFIYIKDTGIAWITNDPFKIKTVIYKGKFRQYINDEMQGQSDAVQKAMVVVSSNISSVFSGDVQALERQFVIEDKGVSDGVHTVVLLPRSDNLGLYVQSIELSGGRFVETVKIVFSEDKYTLVRYRDYQIGDDYISDDERALFNE